MEIRKAPETMTAKERVRRTFEFLPTDRVTIGYEANAVVHQNLCRALGIPERNNLELMQALGVDYVGCGAEYKGAAIYPELPNRIRNAENGAVMRYIANDFGGYWDYCDFPLQNATEEQIAAYPFPNPDDFDIDSAQRQMEAMIEKGFAIHLGHPGMGDILNTTGMIMGVEDALVNVAMEDQATLAMIDRRLDFQLGVLERILNRCGKKVDFLWLGEDLGSQHTPLISKELYRKVLRPRHQRFVDLANCYDLPVLIHTCGSSSWAYDDFMEMGIRGVDTLQPEAFQMDPEYLKQHFGGKLAFRGCISTAGPLAYGTAAEVRAVCKQTLDCLMECRGYHFAPTHAIQDNSPAENVVAMYQAAHDVGRYSL